MILKCSVIFLLSLKLISCVNILFVEPVPSPSHHIWNKALSFALVKKGYNVTVITHDIDKEKPENYSSIILEGIYEKLMEHLNVLDFAEENPNPLKFVTDFVGYCRFVCELDLKTDGLKQLLNYPEDFKFDLIIYDITGGQCLYPIIERFKSPPTVAVTAFLLPPYNSFTFGNRLYTSYIPFVGSRFTDKMSFTERLWNVIYVYYNVYQWNIPNFDSQYALAQEYFGKNIKKFNEVEDTFSFLLANIDPVLDYPQPLPPNIIPVGGLHTRPPNPLPEDLKQIVDSSKKGFIIFSLGTNVRSDQLGKEKLDIILDTFRKLSQTVLWKYESDDLKNLPKNVFIKKWLPINDLLGHPNVLLFITHGGALSTQEAMFHGVPIVGIPFFADQYINLLRMATKQLGVIVNLHTLSTESLYESIQKVISDKSYTKNIKALSKRFRDQPQTPLERAVFYIEYALRHNGAQFLSVSSRHLPFYKSYNLDILGVLLVFIGAVFLTIVKLVSYIIKKFHSPQKIKTN